MPKNKAISPARSQGGATTPKRKATRGSRSLCSPALSTASGRLTSLVDQFRDRNMESFALSPLNGRSVLNDNTEIEEPGRKSWWKKLDENSQDVMDVLEDNKLTVNNPIGDLSEIEVLSQEKKNYTFGLPESSDNESIHSIVLPQRKLFTQKENQPQNKYGHLIDNRESLAKLHKTNNTNIDKTVNVGTRELFQNAKKSKPIFPAALLKISPNKTAADKTRENVLADPKPQVRNIFGSRPANKRKNMFADFIVSESEDEIADIEPKVFGFQRKLEQRRISSVSRGREVASVLSITTDNEMDFGMPLLSSTMVEKQFEDTVASKPVKRARLSNLPEAKESEAGTLQTNTTFDRTKQPNKSTSSKNNSKASLEMKDKSLNSSRTTRSMMKNASKLEESVNTSLKQDAQGTKSKSKISSKGNELDSSSSKTNSNESNKHEKEHTVIMKVHDKLEKTLTNDDKQHEEDDENNFTLEYENDEVLEAAEVPNENQKNNTRKHNTVVLEKDNQETEINNSKSNKSSLTHTSNLSNKSVHKLKKAAITGEESVESQTEQYSADDDVDGKQEEAAVGQNHESKADEMVDQGIEELANKSREKSNEGVEQENEDEVNISEENESENNQEEVNVSQESEDEHNESNESQEVEDEQNESEEVEDEQNESQEVENEENQIEIEEEDDNESEKEEDEANESQEVVNENQEEEDQANGSQEFEPEVNESQEIEEEEAKEIEEEANESQEIDKDVYESLIVDDDDEVEEEEDNESEKEEDEGNENQEEDDQAEESQEVPNKSQEEEDQANGSQEFEPEVNESQEIEEEANESQEIDKEVHESLTVDDDDEAPEQEAGEEMDEDEEEAVNEASANESQEVENDEEESHEVESDAVNENVEHKDDHQIEDSDEADKTIDSDPEISDDNQADEMDVDDDERESDNADDNEQNEQASHENSQIEEQNEIEPSEEIEESPNVTHDTTGRYRKKHLNKSPEMILNDKTNQMNSFTAKGRNTSVRKTKSMIKNLNIKPSLAPSRDSVGFSDGTTNSSAEGSGWDSHRTTRKTLRQTFGKDFTPRKSLRVLVMEKSAKRQTEFMEMQSETKFPLANSTEMPEDSIPFEDDVESDHEASRIARRATLLQHMQKITEQNIANKLKLEAAIRNSFKTPVTNSLDFFKMPNKPAPRRPKPAQSKPKNQIKSNSAFGPLPPEMIEDLKYKPPKRFKPRNASWVTKRLYKYLETKLDPKYDYRARVRAEKLVETIYNFTKDIRRHKVAPKDAVDALKHEFARLEIVRTHYEFYEFFHEFMPRQVRVKVNPDIVNEIPLPRHGPFSDILIGNIIVHE